MGVTLTESAARHVARSLARRGKGVGLRLGVRTSGCSGLAYKLEFADELKAYKTSKGTIQFPIDKPLPAALVKKMVKARITQNDLKQTK